MAQSIVLILTSNVQPSDIETCLKGKWDARPVADMGDRLTIQIAVRDKFDIPIDYVTVRELLPREEVEEDYKTNEFLDRTFVEDLDGHVFYSLRFNERRLFEAVLEQLLRHSGTDVKRTWIDNSLGIVLPAADVFEHGDWLERRFESD